jgi:hypothetical protein
VPIKKSQKVWGNLRKIERFRQLERGALDAGKLGPALHAGMAPQEREGMEADDLLCSRKRGLRRERGEPPDHLSCSRNAAHKIHRIVKLREALVRRAQ